MASPQVENGYIRISTELFVALCHIRISGEARQVLDTVIRKTYGFNKKTDQIALSQFTDSTGMTKTAVLKAIKKLEEMNLIIVTKKGNGCNIFAINKDFDSWKPLPKKETLPKKEISVTKKGKNRYQKGDIQKTVSIDTITKDRGETPTPSQIAKDFFDQGASYYEYLELFCANKDGPAVEREFQKFILYWTEPNKTGKKLRWEQEKTFEVKRRLVTWLERSKNYQPKTQPNIVFS